MNKSFVGKALTMAAVAAISFVGTAAFAAPTAVESFTSFTTMAGAAPAASPSTVAGTTITHEDFGGGATTTATGFAVDPAGYNGNGMTFEGLENTGLLYSAAWPGFSSGAITAAYAVKYTSVAGANQRVQALSFFNTTGIAAGAPFLLLRVGTGATAGANGLIVTGPTAAGFTYGSTAPSAAATPGASFNTVVVQYTPATGAATTDAIINIWINDVNPANPATVSVPTGLGSFEAGNDTFDSLGFGALVFNSVTSPTVTQDELGVWQGNTATELADAMAFIAASASVADWSKMD